MGMTYFEVDAENEADLDKVWPELFKKFSVRLDIVIDCRVY